jgi:hypothetical protein
MKLPRDQGTLNAILRVVASHKHMQKGAITALFSR